MKTTGSVRQKSRSGNHHRACRDSLQVVGKTCSASVGSRESAPALESPMFLHRPDRNQEDTAGRGDGAGKAGVFLRTVW